MRLPQHWRTHDQAYRLAGSMCRACGHKTLPDRRICPACHSRLQVPVQPEMAASLLLYARYALVPAEAKVRERSRQ